MDALPKSLYRAEQVRELDRRTMAALDVSGYTLMERAGAEAFSALRECWPEGHSLCVLCGGGNNGGDGYVIARLAREAGLKVTLVQPGDAARIGGAAAQAREAYLASGGSEADFAGTLPPDTDIIVDALMGTGLDRPLQGRLRELVECADSHPAPVLAVDIPSGLGADTGAVLGAAITARLTVTFIGLKLGLFTGAGPARSGEVLFAGLGAPAGVSEGMEPAADLLQVAELARCLPRRRKDAHKGRFGHVLVVGGNRGMGGAVRLAAGAALRAGAGLVSVATRPEHVPAIIAGRPELMCLGVTGADELAPLLARASVVVLGPGLGRDDWARALFDAVVAAGLPTVLDADGLNLLASAGTSLPVGDWIITPHPGEAARLLEGEISGLEADRPASARRLAQLCGGIAVLKGSGSLVADADGQLSICAAGNPGMASAGMGDVLSGVIAGLRAQGLASGDAARCGVLAHAVAGDTAARAGERGLIASDLIDALRTVVNPG